MIRFFGFSEHGSGGAFWKMTRLSGLSYGSHLSTTTDCGLAGNIGSFSTTTRRGAGANRLPGMTISFLHKGMGGHGGNSLITRGSGVHGLNGTWRKMTGGAGAVGMLASCLITRSPGFGAGGGFKYLKVFV